MFYKEHTRFSFGGHQTFPLRYGWLEKFSLEGIHSKGKTKSTQNQLFNLEYIVNEYGLGQNMAKSLSFWMRACNIVNENTDKQKVFTDFAEVYFGEKGIDPYLEKIETIWVLHWYLVHASKRTSTWFWFFNFFDKKMFERHELIADIMAQCTRKGPHATKAVSEAAVKRDVDCFIKSYLGNLNNKASSEDTLESPFTELGLFRKGSGNSVFLAESERHNLPYGLFIISIFAYWEKLGSSSKTLSFENLLSQPYSPGRLFAINRDGLLDKLERLSSATNNAVSFDQSSGLSQIVINNADEFKENCKKDYLNIFVKGSF